MQLEVYRNNDGRFHWRLVGEHQVALAVSIAEFASEEAARESADAVRSGTGMPELVP